MCSPTREMRWPQPGQIRCITSRCRLASLSSPVLCATVGAGGLSTYLTGPCWVRRWSLAGLGVGAISQFTSSNWSTGIRNSKAEGNSATIGSSRRIASPLRTNAAPRATSVVAHTNSRCPRRSKEVDQATGRRGLEFHAVAVGLLDDAAMPGDKRGGRATKLAGLRRTKRKTSGRDKHRPWDRQPVPTS